MNAKKTPEPAAIDLNAEYAGQQSAYHRRPREAGDADRYYGRPCKPNFSYLGTHFTEEQMTPSQVDEYIVAYGKCSERKKWRGK